MESSKNKSRARRAVQSTAATLSREARLGLGGQVISEQRLEGHKGTNVISLGKPKRVNIPIS